MVAVLCFAFAFTATATFAALTMTATTVSSDGALTITGGSTLTLASTTTSAASLDSGTTGTVNLATGNNAKTINLGTGTAGNTINVGTNNTTLDAINIGSALDTVIITGTSAGLSKVELAATRPTGATSSYQTLAGDLTYQGGAGGTGSFHAGVMGHFKGSALTNTQASAYHAGVIGAYSVDTSDNVTGPKAGVVGTIGVDGVASTLADAAVMAVIDGGDPGAVITANAAYGVQYLNATATAKFTYGLDLSHAAVTPYPAVTYGTADIRLQNGETISNATDGAITISGALTGTPAVLSTTTAGGGSNLKLQYKQITNALTGDYEGLHIRTSTDVGSAANAVNAIQAKAVANDVASQLTVATLRGVYTSVDAKDNLVTTARAFEASLDGLAGSTVTEITGLEVMNNSSGTQTAAYGVSFNGGTPSGHVAFTRDIRFQNGESLDNATDGQFLFRRNTDAAVTIMAADSSGATDLTIDTTGAGAITIGSGDVTSLTVTTDGGSLTLDGNVSGAITRATGATGSYQTISGDLTYEGAAGGTSTYHAGVMGNFLGDTLTNANATIHAGTIGKYSVTTSDALVGPKAGLVGEAETSVANSAVMAVLGGDTGTVTPGAAYGVRYLNSTAASKFGYGLDLYSAAVGSYQAVTYGTADIRLSGGNTIGTGTSVPTSCSAGSIFIDSDSTNPAALLYVCDSDADGDGVFDAVAGTDG